jgi:hypothetical protein
MAISAALRRLDHGPGQFRLSLGRSMSLPSVPPVPGSGIRPDRVPLFGLAHLGQPDEITNFANVGNSCIAAAGVPPGDLRGICRMAPVAASNVLTGR